MKKLFPIDTATGQQSGPAVFVPGARDNDMSLLDHIPAPRIYWDGRKGLAVGPYSRRVLDGKPPLGFRFVEVDYCPGIALQVRRESWHQLADMTAEEAECCQRYLLAMREGEVCGAK